MIAQQRGDCESQWRNFRSKTRRGEGYYVMGSARQGVVLSGRWSAGSRRLTASGRSEQVVKGFGETPLMLLTTEPLRRKRAALWKIASSYFRRWGIEETIRYVKQSYGLEDVRVLRYTSL